jgi:glycine cleavage system H lipoate-binding protein
MKTRQQKTALSPKKRVVGFNILEDQCIWMKAGVVNYRICDVAFNCNTCAFNRAIRQAMQIDPTVPDERAASGWVTYLVERYDGANRPCRHALTGRVAAPKICPHNYECYHCAFDQMLDEADMGSDLARPTLRTVAGFQMADDYYYHMGHGWARFEHGGRIRIGLDDFATCVFGHPDSIDLPPLGARVEQDRVAWTFARGGHHAAVLAPVSGTVLAVNHSVREHPDMINAAPYDDGWLFIVEPELPKRNLKRLFFGEEGDRWIDREQQQLLVLMGPLYMDLAATGGSVVRDIYGAIGTLGWDSLASRFLHTVRKPSA